MSTSKDWFTVDRDGLAKILKRRGIEFALFELIQNAWDEDGVTKVEVALAPCEEKRGRALLKISDDAPSGFKDLAHAFTLFAESAKKGDTSKRGRFNLGEKLVLALCDSAAIYSTTGSVKFNGEGRRVSRIPATVRGTDVFMRLKMTRDEIAGVNDKVLKLIPPAQIETVVNGMRLTSPNLTEEFTALLPTEVANTEGELRPAWKETTVRVYRKNHDAPAMIFEMGIPVVEHDCAFHVDVQQKVPVTLDRENVTPRFLRAMRTAVFNATHEKVTAEETTAEWAQTAVESPNAEPEAVEDYMTKRFGALRASYDMNDPEANSKATANGYTVIKGGMLSGAAWGNAKRFEAITPAGQIFPTHPGNGIPFEEVQPNAAMQEVASYAKECARLLLECAITVRFGKQPSREAACWGSRMLQFNVRNLGARWFDLANNRRAIDDLLIHEFGHHYESNHLSEGYYNALTRIASHMVELARKGQI